MCMGNDTYSYLLRRVAGGHIRSVRATSRTRQLGLNPPTVRTNDIYVSVEKENYDTVGPPPSFRPLLRERDESAVTHMTQRFGRERAGGGALCQLLLRAVRIRYNVFVLPYRHRGWVGGRLVEPPTGPSLFPICTHHRSVFFGRSTVLGLFTTSVQEPSTNR